MSQWQELFNPHLKDRIKILSEDDWLDIERVAYALMAQHGLPILVAEANAMVAMVQSKEKGDISRLLN